MNNYDCIVAVLAAHRAMMNWTDEDVARDLVAQLGLDPVGEASNAKPVPVVGITEDEVLAHEAAAQAALDKAKAARAELNAAAEKEAADKAEVAAQQAETLKASNSETMSDDPPPDTTDSGAVKTGGGAIVF